MSSLVRSININNSFRVRELAWLCPNNARCCEWECCIDRLVEEEEGWMETLFKFIFFFLFYRKYDIQEQVRGRPVADRYWHLDLPGSRNHLDSRYMQE